MDKEITNDFTPNEYENVHFHDGRVKLLTNDDERLLTEEELLQQTLEYYPDHWISENRKLIQIITDELKYMSTLSTLGDGATFSDIAEYLEYCHTEDPISKVNWEDDDLSYYVMRCPNKTNPSNKQFMRHFLMELYDVYKYFLRNYNIEFGPFEDFCDFIYIYSSSAFQIPND